MRCLTLNLSLSFKNMSLSGVEMNTSWEFCIIDETIALRSHIILHGNSELEMKL